MIKCFSLLSILFFSQALFAQNALLESLNLKARKNFRLSSTLTHISGFGDERVEPLTFLSLSLDYTISKTLHMDVFGRGAKFYYLDFESEQELRFTDFYVGLRHIVTDSLLDGTAMISYGYYFPVSRFSIDNSIMGTAYLGATNTWSFLENKLFLTAGLDGLYNFNKYTTGKTRPTGSGGSPLAQYSLGGGLTLSYSLGNALGFKTHFLKSFLLSARGSYTRVKLEDFKVPPVQATSFRTIDDSYRTSLSLTASPYKKFFVSLGYAYRSEIEVEGRTEYFLFDSLASTWSASLRYSTRF